MARVVKRFNYATRSIVVHGTIEFSSMGKWVTDYLSKIRHVMGWSIEDVTEAELADVGDPPPPGLGSNAGDQMVPPDVIRLPDHYYILGDGNLYARHLFRRDGEHVKLVAIIIDAEAGERIANALQEG